MKDEYGAGPISGGDKSSLAPLALFITHALPKALLVDEVVRIGEKLALIADDKIERGE